MFVEYRCPVCRANNKLTEENSLCRRCEVDLSSIYTLNKKYRYDILNKVYQYGKEKEKNIS